MADVRIRWLLDVVDRGAGKKLLAEDRQIRRSLQATDAQYRRTATVAASAGSRQAAASKRVAAARSAETREARVATGSVRRLSAAQSSSIGVQNRASVTAHRVAGAYDRQAAAAQRLSGAERTRARATRAAGQAAGSSAATGAAGGAGATRLAGSAARGAGLAGAVIPAAALATTLKFDAAMRNVNSIAQLSERQFESLSDKVRRLAGPTAQAPVTLAAGMYDLVSSGFKANDALRIINKSARAATAGLTTTEVSTGAVAAVLNAYHLPAARAGLVSDQLFRTVDRGVISFEQLAENVGDVLPFAASLGVGLDQVGASIATMTKAGISAPETMTRIKAVMTAMLKPGKDLQGTIKDLGFESGEALIKQKGFQGALDALAKATGGSKQELAKLFPNVRALGGALALTGSNSRGARSDLEGMRDASGATARALEQQSKSVKVQWDRLKASAAALGIQVGRHLVPPLHRAVAALGDLLSGKGKGGGTIKQVSAGIRAGLTGRTPTRPVVREGRGGRPFVAQEEDTSKTTQVAQKVGAALRSAGEWAVKTGKQLLDAFKPATPYLRNVMLPVIIGVGKGLVGAIGAALKVVIPAIKIWATALGFVGRLMRPFRGILEKVGMVIAFVFGGVILKAVGTLGKLGGVFRIIGGAARVLAAPVRLVNAAFIGLGRGVLRLPAVLGRLGGVLSRAGGFFSRFPGRIAGVAGRVFSAAGRLVSAAGRALSRLPARLAVNAYAGGRAVITRLGAWVGKAAGVGGRIVSAVVRGIGRLPGRIADLGKSVGGAFFRFGKGLVGRVVDAVKSAPGAIIGAIRGLVPGPLRSVAKKIPGNPLNFRRGGRARRYQTGGLVPVNVSSGEELVFPGGQSMIVPGPRVAADNVTMAVPATTAVLTDHGQWLRSQGMSLGATLGAQAPHFQTGGRAGLINDRRKTSWRGKTSVFGPPLEAAGRTATGASSAAPGIATRNRATLGKLFTVQVGSHAAYLTQTDLGPAAWTGRAIDITGAGARRLGFNPRRFPTDRVGTAVLGRRKARTGERIRGGDVELAPRLSFAGSLPSRTATIAAGFEAGQSGARLSDSISDIVTGATSQLERRTRSVSGSSRAAREAARSGGGRAVARAIIAANTIDKRGFPYSSPGNRSPRLVAGPMDCSGAVFKVLKFAGLSPPGGNVAADSTHYKAGWGAGGSGRHITTHSKGGSGASGHVFMTINGRDFGTSGQNPGGGAGWFNAAASYKRQFIHRHPRGFRRGGRVGSSVLRRIPEKWRTPQVLAEVAAGGILPGLRTGGIVARFRRGGNVPTIRGTINTLVDELPTTASRSRIGAALTGFADLIEQVDEVTAGILRQRLADVRARARRLLAGGLRRRERPAYRRLVAESRGIRGDLRQVDHPVSFARLTQIERSLGRRIARVRRGGVRGIDERVSLRRLTAAQRVVQTEMGRRLGLVSGAVEKQATTLERARNALSRSLRVGGVDEASSAGLAALQNLGREQIKVLGRTRARLERDLRRARRLGDRSAVTAISDQLDELRETIAESATTLIEQARAQVAAAAQERVDLAAHGSTVAGLKLARFELEQRLAGTADTGGAARAEFIRRTIAPAVNAEIVALQGQLAAAHRSGDPARVREVLEALLGKQNEAVQVALDIKEAAEQTAENTDALKEFSGTTAFEAFSERWTDKLLGATGGL